MAMILDAFVGRYVDKLSELVEGEMSMTLGVKGELKKLQRRMERIRGFLESAERKRYADPNINAWVRELKDVMYDADDIIDRCMIEGRLLLENHASPSAVRHPSSSFSSFGFLKFQHEIGNKIEELNDRLKEINEDLSKLPALEYTRQTARKSGVNTHQTFSTMIKSDIVGTDIQKATQSLVESLIKQDNKKYRVLGIVGMGGIGKTTLATNIYNDEKIIVNFPKRVWVCISQEFSETNLLKEIIRGLGGNCEETETKAELVPRLSSSLLERFFIVLDDVWKPDVWDHLLRYPFESANADGRIVITTRHTSVAQSIRAEIHHVDKMDNDNGWKLLCKTVLRDDEEEEEEEEISSLKEIGVQIVEKCDGLPLAIKVIAGVLRSKERSNLEWNKVLKSKVWSMSQLEEQLPRALFLSYECLPSHIKQCFLYCSLFPEDYIMRREDLIRFWVAECFVKSAQEGILMEDLAEDCYRELIGRSLLHGHDHDTHCRMHDLLRSLALFLIDDESTVLGDGQSPKINPLAKIRRSSMVNMGERVEVPDAIKQQKCLRTLLLFRSPEAKIVEIELFRSLRLLRVLKLTETELESFPDSIGDLLHLRYLNLNGTKIRALPESIGCLVNLQILELSHCVYLHTLPRAVTKLYNLRCLRLHGTPLTHVPKGIYKLKHLNHFEGLVVGHDDRRDMQDDDGCGLEALQSLSQLRFLSITNLDRAQPGGARVLANSQSLRALILKCQPSTNTEEAIATQRIYEIYNELCPPSTYLQRLEIHNFFGTEFPDWMMSHSLRMSFRELTKIILHNCKSCPQLPPLGLLPQLKSLSISGAHTIKIVGPEFLGPHASSTAASFPKLETLKFDFMSIWEEWSFGMMEGVGEERRGAPKLLPRLRTLTLDGCPKLKALPPLGLLPQLKSLEITGAQSIIAIGPEFLGSHASSGATSFPKLEELGFSWMEKWEEWSFGMVEGVGEERRGAPKLLPCLRKLLLYCCPKLRALPEGLRHATNLQELRINTAGNLKEINNLPSLKSLDILNCLGSEHVENLDKLQFLRVNLHGTSTTDADGQTERLPQWLLELLGQHPLQKFDLTCSLPLLKTFLKDGPNWPIIQRIPHVSIEEHWRPDGRFSYIRFTQDHPTFEANVVE